MDFDPEELREKAIEMVNMGAERGVTMRILGHLAVRTHVQNNRELIDLLQRKPTHDIDFMRQIMGEAKRVTAGAGRYVETEIDYEDMAMLLIEFENGGFGQLLAGHCAQIGAYDVKLFCTGGTVLCRPGSEMRYKKVGEDEAVASEGDLAAEPGVRREVREFVECVLNDTEPTIPGEEGVRNVEIAEAALISAAENRPVDLPL